MKTKDVIILLKTGQAVTFPVQYTMHVLLELSKSNVHQKFTGNLANEEVTLQFVEDQTTLN
jgi:hypothetical protein